MSTGLEEELGAALFERSSRYVRLTPAGQAFLRQAYAALDAVRRIPDDVAAASGEIRGQLSLGSISALGKIDIVALVSSFHEQYPRVDVRLSQSGSEELMDWLRDGRLDVALIGLWHGDRLSGLDHLHLGEERLVAVLPPWHSLASTKGLTLEKLATLPLVDYPRGSSARRQTDKAFAAAGVLPKINFEVNHVGLIARFVGQGLAASLVPESVAASLRDVAYLPVRDAPKRILYAVWGKAPTPSAVAFVALLHRYVQSAAAA